MDTLILNQRERDILLKLMNESGNIAVNEFKLIHRASRDGWNGSIISTKLIGKSNVLSIIHTDTDNVFGGFIKSTIHAKNQWVRDNDAFLLLLRSSKQYPAAIFPIAITRYAIYVYSGIYWIAQYGSDLYIYSECNDNNMSAVAVSDYKVPGNTYLNGGIENFKVCEMEFYICSNC